MSPGKPVSQERFGEALKLGFHRKYTLELEGFQLSILHGLVALATDHPGIKGMSPVILKVIREVRDFCLAAFRDWGLDEEEVFYLDTMRVEVQSGKYDFSNRDLVKRIRHVSEG